MRPYDVHVQSLVPYYVKTKMVAYSGMLSFSNLFTPYPDTYAKSAILTFGQYQVNTGYFPHTVQVSVTEKRIAPFFEISLKRIIDFEFKNAISQRNQFSIRLWHFRTKQI